MTDRLKKHILIVPIGDIDKCVIDLLAGKIPEKTGMKALLTGKIDVPSEACDEERGQYFGDNLLDTLRNSADRIKGFDRTPLTKLTILGIIDKDCFADNHNFIFGEAMLRGGESFIALPRLRQSYYGQPENDDLFKRRIVKEAVHEIGHTAGLVHCPDQMCVMHFSNTLKDTDVKNDTYCVRCLRIIEAHDIKERLD